MGPDLLLIRERCTYPPPEFRGAPPRSPLEGRWVFEDTFGNRQGRLYEMLAPAEAAQLGTDRIDTFNREVILSEIAVGPHGGAVVTADDEGFSVHWLKPLCKPTQIFRQREKVMVRGISADGTLIALDAAGAEGWLRPDILVLDREGRVQARLNGFGGVPGCWAGEWHPSRVEQRLLFTHESNGYAAIGIWDPTRGTTESVHIPLDGELEAKWDRSGQRLLVRRVLNGRSDLHWFHRHERKLQRIQPLDGVVFRWEISESNEAVGLWSSNERHIERFHEAQRFVTQRFAPSAPLNGWEFRRIAGVPCFLVRSRRVPANGWTIFDGYGGVAYHHFDGYNRQAQVLADHGFLVVMVNTRGCNGFGRAWREATLGDLGHTELDDLRRVRETLLREGVAQEDRTMLTGSSWGGYMALLALGTQPQLWRAAVAYAPIGDYEHAHWEASPLIRAANRSWFGGDARTQAAVYRKASPLTYVDAIRAPVLILCGRHDHLCPPIQNRRFVEALRARGGECDFDLFEGGHGAPTPEERTRQQLRIVKFFLLQAARVP